MVTTVKMQFGTESHFLSLRNYTLSMNPKSLVESCMYALSLHPKYINNTILPDDLVEKMNNYLTCGCDNLRPCARLKYILTEPSAIIKAINILPDEFIEIKGVDLRVDLDTYDYSDKDTVIYDEFKTFIASQPGSRYCSNVSYYIESVLNIRIIGEKILINVNEFNPTIIDYGIKNKLWIVIELPNLYTWH